MNHLGKSPEEANNLQRKYIVLISAKGTQANNQCRTSSSKLSERNLLSSLKQQFLKQHVVPRGELKTGHLLQSAPPAVTSVPLAQHKTL